MKKLMYLASALAAAVPALAQDGPSASPAEQMFEQATGLVNEVQPLLVTFLVLSFGIVIAFVSYKLAKRGANKI